MTYQAPSKEYLKFEKNMLKKREKLYKKIAKIDKELSERFRKDKNEKRRRE